MNLQAATGQGSILRSIAALLGLAALLGVSGCATSEPDTEGTRATSIESSPESSRQSESAAGSRSGSDAGSEALLDEPTTLAIPRIDVDENLMDLGLNADGSMEVPEDADRAGWFTGGGRPGGPGPTVLAGHVDSADGPAVFDSLRELEPGDEVTVTTASGDQVTYRVDRIEDYSKGSFPTADVFGATAHDELRLITCSGAWDSVGSQYTDNKVVYASPVEGD